MYHIYTEMVKILNRYNLDNIFKRCRKKGRTYKDFMLRKEYCSAVNVIEYGKYNVRI